ncbi:EthD family reductase [Bosea thiooxidans]
MVKLISLLTRHPHLTKNEFMRMWVEDHAPMALKVPGLRRYSLSFIIAEPSRADVPDQSYSADGIAELWFDSEEAMKAVLESPELQHWRAHGATFIGKIKAFLVEEKVIIGETLV